ncbi:MAG TPA: histidine kinase dimerization/phosphoacceptor domain -containing protein [Allosphingosinicella sp.]|jgi:light-regulated signal transduction histidine kinase (bacteriophytochrome)
MADLPQARPDLTACDREPIHIPGAIQPHGLLLALEAESGLVRRAAGDFAAIAGFEKNPIGASAEDVLGPDAAALIGSEAGYLGAFTSRTGAALDVTAHRSALYLVVEAEPAAQPRLSAAEAMAQVQSVSRAIARAPDVVRACQAAADAVQGFTGYDRIMIYRFLDDGAGRVVAESAAAGTDPFLHHHFPATDIPAQARALYLRNLIRVIPDVSYRPAAMIGGEGDAPLDMSDSGLRSVSPVHIQYLKNMGVGASASVSLVVDGALWGLIACHHATPRHIPYEVREMAKHVGQILANDIRARGEAAVHGEVLSLTRRREEVVPLLDSADSLEAALRSSVGTLKSLLPCDGVAVYDDGAIAKAGVAPPDEAVKAIALWTARPEAQACFSTHQLSKSFPEAEAYADKASGLMTCVVRRNPPLVLMWTRAEQVETVNWAGNPHKAGADEAGMLTPRASFDAWAETVRGRSAAWSPAELEAGRRFSAAVREIGWQKKLVQLNGQLRVAVADRDEMIEQKDLMMREAHHRVQNSLQLVISMLQLQERDISDELVRQQLELARQRIMAVAMVHRRLWRADQIATINLDTFFGELAEGLARGWGEEWLGQLKIDVAPVQMATTEAVVVALVVTELLTNAVKHAYRGAVGPLELRVRELAKGALQVVVADSGVGGADSERAGSFGSKLTMALVRQLRGEIGYEDNDPGSRIVLSLPFRQPRGVVGA